MLKLLWKIKWLRRFLRGSKKCRSLVETSQERCDDYVIRGTPYCYRHQAKFPWFISILPVLFSLAIGGFILPPIKSKWFPSEVEQTLRKISREKKPKIQFFVKDRDNKSDESLGTLIRVGVVVVPIDREPRRFVFLLQNMGEAPLEGIQTTVRYDRRLSLTNSDEPNVANISFGAGLGMSKDQDQFTWREDGPVYSPDSSGLAMTFLPNNPIEQPMNMNFYVQAKGAERFQALLTLFFIKGTGNATVLALPDAYVPTNGQFVLELGMRENVLPRTNQ